MDWVPPPDVPALSPVTIECVIEASREQEVPLAAVVAILATEGGRVGRVSINANATYDIGPMQINSSWLDELAGRDVSEALLLNSGCVNVLVGAWILRQALAEARGDVWVAIGRYHSRTGELAQSYQRRVYENLQRELNVRDVVARANGGPAGGRPAGGRATRR